MIKCIFDRASGLFVAGAKWDAPPHDPKTHVLVELPAFPDRRAERWNGAAGIRPASAEELAEFDAIMADAEISARLADDAMLGAVVKWVAGQLGVTPEQARADIGDAYKAEMSRRT